MYGITVRSSTAASVLHSFYLRGNIGLRKGVRPTGGNMSHPEAAKIRA